MLYGSMLLRTFSAFLMVSVLTACGGGGGSGGDDTNPPVTPPTDNGGGGGGGGGGGTDTGSTGGDTGGTGSDTGGTGGDTGGGNGGTGGDTGGTGGDTGGTGGDTGGTGGTGSDTGISGVWKLEIPARFIALVESLNYSGIVDEWLPGRQILMIDHGTSIDVSTCIDNLNLPPAQLFQTSVAGVYQAESSAGWVINGFEVIPSVTRQTDGSFVLTLTMNGSKLADIPATKRTALNNQFVLQGDAIAAADTTNLTCAVKTPDANVSGAKVLNVATWYEDNFLFISFPSITGVGQYDYVFGEVVLGSEPLMGMVNTYIDSANLDVTMPAIGKLQLTYDLTTEAFEQLHGEVKLNENPLP